MKPITKGISGGVVKELLVPNPEALSCPAAYDEALESLQFKHAQPLVVLDDQDTVILTLVQRNKLHLHQAYDTPFAQKDMQDCIGEFGSERGAQEILDGKFDPNQFKNLPAVNFWIKHNLCCAAAANSVNIQLSVDGFKGLLKKQNKSTSSSPSGRHYGHYKVLLEFDNILEMHCRMMTLPFCY
eukprot:2416084-Ditylum_brightwellii.AAC.1